MPDDLTQAAQRAREVLPPIIALMVERQLRYSEDPDLIAEVLALPASAPDREALVDVMLSADSSYDMVAMHEDTPGGYGLVEHLADALIAAGLVRTPGPALDREALGQKVREVWIDWASEQPDPKTSWLVPWEGLSESDREVDRRIGEALAAVGGASVRTPVTSEQIEQAAKAVHAESEKCWTTPHAWKDELPTVQEMYRRYSRAAAKALGLSVVEGDA